MKISHLRCCLLIHPLGVDWAKPELSWELEAPSHGHAFQKAYQIIMAGSAEALKQGGGEIWDSGKVWSGKTAFIPYGGPPLRSRQECHWKVRVWDESGEMVESDPAFWSMGLLRANDWKARWIGLDTPPEYPQPCFGHAQWIWTESLEPAVLRFYTEFNIGTSELADIGNAWIESLADDEAEIEINGQPVGRASRARVAPQAGLPFPTRFWILPFLRAGSNTLSLTARKRTRDLISSLDAAGFIARLWLMPFSGATKREIVTDRNWHCEDMDGKPCGIVEKGCWGVPPWSQHTFQEDRNLRARYLRTEIELPSVPRRATLYFCGLGTSEAWINGRKVGDEVLSPNLTDYHKRVFYRTFDVRSHLRAGANALGAILGNGRYFAPRAQFPFPLESYGCPCMLWQLEIEFEDGRKRVIASGPDWKITDKGPTGWNNEFDGEYYDASVRFDGWSEPGFAMEGWKEAQIVTAPLGRLVAQMEPPARVIERVTPIGRWRTKYGSDIFDFGANLVGWCRARITGPAGVRVLLTHAERLDGQDALFMDNLRSCLCRETIVLGGEPVDYEPKFVYHGFRYVEMRTEGGDIESIELEAAVVHDDMAATGNFSCSNATINSVTAAITRGVRENYRSVPTDCPQRDERLGWLGDRAGGAPCEMFFFDVASFYRKWVDDMREAQTPTGCVPDLAPPYWRNYHDNVTWPCCLVFIPYWLYRHYGDKTAICRNYEAIDRWLGYQWGMVGEDGLTAQDCYGDWCVPPENPELIHSTDPLRKTPGPLLASAYLMRCFEMAAVFARLLGREEDEGIWNSRARALADAVHARYYHMESGDYATGSQTADLLPLAFAITPEAERPRVFESLTDKIVESGTATIGTGLVGSQWLLRTLTAHGRGDLAASLAARSSYPSWGYMVEHGATTLWELWNGDSADPEMSSHNHVMLQGDYLRWLFEDLAGIQPALPGFERIAFRPVFPAMLDWVEARHHSVRGPISSSWKRQQDGTISWQVEIPANTIAEVFVALKPQGCVEALKSNSDCAANQGQRIEAGWKAVLTPGAHTLCLTGAICP